jgi:hypothetical protein
MAGDDVKRISRIAKEVGLTRAQRRMLHEENGGQHFASQEIRPWPGKTRSFTPR